MTKETMSKFRRGLLLGSSAIMLGLGMGVALDLGCSHSNTNTPAALQENTAEVSGPMRKADSVFYAEKDRGAACSGDSDCTNGDICHPEFGRCITSYPNPRMLDVSFSAEAKEPCKLVNVYFPYDSTQLVADAQRWLEYDMRCLKSQNPKEVVVKGFADSRGSDEYNLKLSVDRSKVVKTELVQAGLAVPVTVQGLGERAPLRSGKSEKDFAYNRRVEFIVR